MVCACADLAGARCHPLSAEPCRCAGRRGCNCGSSIAPTCSIGRASRRWGRGWFGFWRPRSPKPERAIGRLDILSPEERHTILRTWNDTAHPIAASDPARAVCRAGGANARCGRGGVRGAEPQLRRTRCPRQPAGASSARVSASVPKWWSGCASSARWRCWSGCSASSRPAAPICRSIPAYPPERLAFMLEDAGAPVLVTQSALLRPAARHRGARSCASMPIGPPSRASPRPRRAAAWTRTTPPTSSTPRARPARRKASRSATAAFPILRQPRSMRFAITPQARVLQFASLELRRGDLGDCHGL